MPHISLLTALSIVSQGRSTLIFLSVFMYTIKSVVMSAQSIQNGKRPRVVMIFEIKLKMIRNMEADLYCYKKVLI
jgi:hypothetical protein